MTEAGFFEKRRTSPTSLAMVIAVHAAALAAVILVKGPVFIGPDRTPIATYDVPIPPPPPPEPQQQRRHEMPHREQVYVPPTARVTRRDDPPVIATREQFPPPPPIADPGPVGPPVATPHPTVRLAAQFDPRYRDALQPPYPASEQRLDHEGSVRVRVVIGADGRVKEIARLSATSDAFWEATRRQALGRWRFRPATEDGRPVESSLTLTVNFELTGEV